MDNPQISIIVPVYNAEKYLCHCVDSILAQTFTDFELLLIDDGSTDASGKICDEYASKDCRVRAFHKKNSGASDARNIGIDNSLGNYMAFVDADDYINASFLYDLIDCMDGAEDVSLVLQSPIREYADGRQEAKDVRTEKYEGTSGLADFIRCGFLMYSEPHSKLFNASIIRTNSIKFPSQVKIGEDGIFIAQFLKYAKAIITSDKHGYYYRKCYNSVQSKIYSYAIERRGYDLWKSNLYDLCKSVNVEESEMYIWPLLSIPMKRAILSICRDPLLSLRKKHQLLSSFEPSDYKNYGNGRHYGFNGSVLKIIINRKMIGLVILLSAIFKDK